MDYIKIFVDHIISSEGLSKNTVESYTRDLNKLQKYFSNKSMLEITFNDLKNYVIYLNSLYKNQTISRNISSIKHFYDFLQLQNILKDNPSTMLEHSKQEKKLPKFLTEEEIIEMLKISKQDRSDYGIQMNCMMQLLYATGMRVSELVSLKLSSIEKEYISQNRWNIKNKITILGKGNKERIVPLNYNSVSGLTEYLKLREKLLLNNYSEWLFTTKVKFSKEDERKISFKEKRDNHITRQVFARHLKLLAEKSGINLNRISPHVIRHSVATHLLNNGADIRVIQEILGHTSLSTTQIYTHITDQNLVNTVKRLHPLKDLIKMSIKNKTKQLQLRNKILNKKVLKKKNFFSKI